MRVFLKVTFFSFCLLLLSANLYPSETSSYLGRSSIKRGRSIWLREDLELKQPDRVQPKHHLELTILVFGRFVKYK